ncbi:MAG: glycoside hydrolase family 9 protein [Defluviitaleaceae bacterium]|nr:glycoside hydrolase family 9 protein [Defluviitaleaceae bacterium]
MKSWIRANQAGYTPNREKKAIVLSETDISGAAWGLKKDGKTILSGELSSPGRGDDFHVAQEFYYTIDFSAATEQGIYSLELENAEAQKIIVNENPYELFAAQAIGHLRRMRSGCATDVSGASHPGDAAAIVYEVSGDWRQGAWKEAVPRRTVDMHGGHYDAGDCIKFTLTEANMVWHLLRAYEENPALFAKEQILGEAKYGLDYLAKTFPDENTFVVQVGDGKDHIVSRPLPETEVLDGKRPALCALSRVHMGVTAAALALGAHVFAETDREAAALYASKAKAIYARARQNDTQTSAFERDHVNDFYYDETDVDNMALAAAELYRLTKEQKYLDDGKAYAPPPVSSVSWSLLNGQANHRLAEAGDVDAKKRLLDEAALYNCENVWSLPGGEYTWGSLPVWIGMANNLVFARRLSGERTQPAPFLRVLDYTFGRNNWGLAMLASEALPNPVKNIYSWISFRLGKYVTGALSEGPGKKAMHDGLSGHFETPRGGPLDKFNTSEAVFFDNGEDFMIQESTIWGQGNLILMLALAGAPKAQ